MKKIKYLSLVLISVLALTGCGGNKEEKPKEEVKEQTIELKENLNLEINSEVNLLSLISDNNKVEILSEDEKIDTSKLGEKELIIRYKDNEKDKEYSFKINIIDTTKPTIEYKKELTTTTGTKIDLLKGVKVSDNSKEEIKATIDGSYDFNKEGTYKLKYIAVDSSNNKTEEEFTLKVNKKATTNNNNSNNNTNSNNNNNNNSVETCNFKSGTITSTKPNNACKYEVIELEWAYLPKTDDEENTTFSWALDGAWGDDGTGHKTQLASEMAWGLPYDASMFSKFRPTTKPNIDDDNARVVKQTVYKIK